MLSLQGVHLSRGRKALLVDASLTLFKQQKIGLVGRNGCGKSSLFAVILGLLEVDAGDCTLESNLKISYLEQKEPDSTLSAIDYVLHGDEAYAQIIMKLDKAELDQDHDKVMSCHFDLEKIDGYRRPAQAAKILAGLGFSEPEQGQSVNTFSGGWRMRLNLARCLLKPSEVLLLDEPTNHLDMEAIYWFERWLREYTGTIILISHDRDFLDSVVSHIVHIENQKTTLYTGNYSQFERARAEKLILQQSQYQKQQQKIEHMMSFVTRFKAKASKARQAKSRLKAIERMEVVAQAQMDSPFSFDFFEPASTSNPLIRLDHADIGYSNPVLNNVNFSVDSGERIALLGPNGAGKSTLIKALIGELSLLSGEVHRSNKLQVGYYAQHMMETIDTSLSPLEIIWELSPTAKEQAVRNFLGGFAFVGDMAKHPATHFSGGEKARLALARLVWMRPNILLLDEPTNHLDLDMRSAIELALQTYEGAVIIVSHDRHLLRNVVESMVVIYDGTASPFDGSLDDYYNWLQQVSTKKPKSAEVVSQPKQDTAPNREKQKRLRTLETQITKCQNKLHAIDEKLTVISANTDASPVDLQSLNKERAQHQVILDELEEEWLGLH